MKLITISGLFIMLIVCSCSPRTSKGELQIENNPKQQLKSESGLLFDISRYRGTDYTDSQGTKYTLRYRPITITNDSTISIHLQFAFLKEYAYDDNKFKMIPLPREWGVVGGDWDVMWKEFPKYFDNPVLEETIEPGEKIIIAIGELLPSPVQFSINIDALFVHTNSGVFPACEWQMEENPSSDSGLTLGLNLNFSKSCSIIPCGQVSFPKD